MAHYYCLLLDMDGTLLDFEAAEHKAILETLEHFELPSDHETEMLYVEITKSSGPHWKKARSSGTSWWWSDLPAF